MKKFLYAILFLGLINNNCKSQQMITEQQYLADLDKFSFKYFDIKKFQTNKGRGKNYINDHGYDYDTPNGYSIVQDESKNRNEIEYDVYVEKKNSPFRLGITYYDNGIIKSSTSSFNDRPLITKRYDSLTGRLINTIDYNKKFKHSFEDIRNIFLQKAAIDIFDTRQAKALRVENPAGNYYQIHVLKTINGHYAPDYSVIVDDVTGKVTDSGRSEQIDK